jgi:hypothetical protein
MLWLVLSSKMQKEYKLVHMGAIQLELLYFPCLCELMNSPQHRQYVFRLVEIQ